MESPDLNAELVSSNAIGYLTPVHQHRTGGMFHDRVGHAPHEIFVSAASAARPDNDEVGPLARGECDELSPWRAGQHNTFRGESGFPQHACDSGREFLGLTSEHSLDLVSHRKSPRRNTKAFQRERRNHTGDRHGRTNMFRQPFQPCDRFP